VKKTGRLVIVHEAPRSFGVGAEIAALVAENAFDALKAPILRVALPDCPAPASRNLEEAYYPTAKHVVQTIRKLR